jgi:hypothetical protein
LWKQNLHEVAPRMDIQIRSDSRKLSQDKQQEPLANFMNSIF